MVQYKNPPHLIAKSKTLRQQSTLPERLLWNALRELRRKSGLKFRRQHPVHPYIADFACIERRVLIELDGLSHDSQIGYDQKRGEFLRSAGWTIIRFPNDDVLHNIEGVVMHIEQTLNLNDAHQRRPTSGRAI